MRRISLPLLTLLTVVAGAVWLSCGRDDTVVPTEESLPIEGDEGAALYEWAIGPIEGITTAWHPTPQEIFVPVGTTIQLKCGGGLSTDLHWVNAREVRRDANGSIAEFRVAAGLQEVRVEIPSGETGDGGGGGTRRGGGGTIKVEDEALESASIALHACMINGVSATAKDFAVRELKVTGAPMALSLTESSTGFETMRVFFAGGDRYQVVSALRQVGVNRYRTAVERQIDFNAMVSDPRFASMIEVRLPGVRPQLSTSFEGVFSEPGEHVVSVGPTANPTDVMIETYEVVITSHQKGRDFVRDSEPITFVAQTNPTGYEDEITWISSTKYGEAHPVVGHGPRFTVEFQSTTNGDSWLGVRADNAVFSQDGSGAQLQVAFYVRDHVLGGAFGDVNLWMTPGPLDPSHVVRDVDPLVADVPMPYQLGWSVYIDDYPFADFGHPSRWLFVNANLSTHTSPTTTEFPPSIWANGGVGPRSPFGCVGVPGALACPSNAPSPSTSAPEGTDKACLHAVLISGGWSDAINYPRYAKNLRSMFKKLRAGGYPKANIFVYYTDGTDLLDLDNADNDGNDATGSDVTGGATEANIRTKIQTLCSTLDPSKDVLLIYTTNHGANAGLCLWDFDGNEKISAAEIYTPQELVADTQNCKVCRLFIIMIQCHSGQFLGIAGDGNHANTAIYTSTAGNESHYVREYMWYWEALDPSLFTADGMHDAVVAHFAGVQRTCWGGVNNDELCITDSNCPGGECIDVPKSTPQSASGSAGVGNVSILACWGDTNQPLGPSASLFDQLRRPPAISGADAVRR